MRLLLVVVAALSAGLASAQTGMLGVGGGVSWEVRPEGFSGRDFLRGDDPSLVVTAGAHLGADTLVRLQARDLSRTTLVGGAPWTGRLRAYTVGTDYFVPGTFGQACFSGGVGVYRLDLAGENAPAGVESQEFGWYLGVGEWFRLSHRGRLVGEIVMDRTGHPGTPTLLTANVMLVVQF